METDLFVLAEDIRLRQEGFGGLVFNKRTGDTIDIDREAFELLLLIRLNQFLSQKELLEVADRFGLEKESILKIIKEFVSLGVILKTKALAVEIEDRELNFGIAQNWLSYQHLSAPETVHWAITYACSKDCLDCYAQEHKGEFEDLNTAGALEVVDKLAEWGVFQLAIGGGEALERDDLTKITKYAHQKGLVVHITTGVDEIDAGLLKELAKSVTSLQLGLKHHKLLEEGAEEFARLESLVAKIKGFGLETGINLMMSKSVIENFERIISYLSRLDSTRVVLLRYKPPLEIEQWLKEKPSDYDLIELEKMLAKASREYDLDLRLDCGLSFLQRSLKASQAKAKGLRGCVAGERILALAPDGSIFPCSQLVGPDFKAGNILSNDLDRVWKEESIIKHYRFFKQQGFFKKSICNYCAAVEFCGGCPVFSDSGRKADPACPQPMVSHLKQLDSNGRKAEFKRYFEDQYSVSVKEYMERYGVGQKCAVKELRSISYLTKVDKKATGKKQKDRYYSIEEDSIEVVQGAIGYTSGGVPFAGQEEIRGWISEDDDRSYPEWKR
ncbi:radical SAM/SPASM domain-containing protein [Fuchsiella alkaliacetigena]|uniref:radical SAM/SPASM domain-containing protein n=1 Tax=Fuchsiella alkaliacetigena TaxID=957042 RepID=UPI00200A2242|nr:radical SAM protein [Fuchsiella alkaliacetigena]MCK8825403.1 radical SAM protein [Fuchsiella alkaliacetigena]